MKKRILATFALLACTAAQAAPPCNLKSDDHQPTPLTYSALRGDIKNVRCLLDSGVDPNTSDPGGTALMAAVNNGHTETVRLLIERGAD
ncbi:MAG: ankyrin repeat domain-containing protein, partial [Ottowia sp.]|nr:ankyrin repeat domain-containing protein [Ottowia sp.]